MVDKMPASLGLKRNTFFSQQQTQIFKHSLLKEASSPKTTAIVRTPGKFFVSQVFVEIRKGMFMQPYCSVGGFGLVAYYS
jgi:hypothetical protein